MKIHYARLFYWLSLSNGICSMSLIPGTVQFYGVVPINQTWRAGRVICCFFFPFYNSGNYLSKRDLNKFVEIKPSVVTPFCQPGFNSVLEHKDQNTKKPIASHFLYSIPLYHNCSSLIRYWSANTKIPPLQLQPSPCPLPHRRGTHRVRQFAWASHTQKLLFLEQSHISSCCFKI